MVCACTPDKRKLCTMSIGDDILCFIVFLDSLGQVVDGQDLMCKSRTGSGKTLAFAIPIVEALDRQVMNESFRVHYYVLLGSLATA